MYIYVYIYIHIHIHTYICVYIYIYVCMYTNIVLCIVRVYCIPGQSQTHHITKDYLELLILPNPYISGTGITGTSHYRQCGAGVET